MHISFIFQRKRKISMNEKKVALKKQNLISGEKNCLSEELVVIK